jgi:hypothetical protein
MATWIIIAGVVILLAAIIVGRILEVRDRPRCPVHKRAMELVGEWDGEEFACRVKGCTECADRSHDGTVRHFRT